MPSNLKQTSNPQIMTNTKQGKQRAFKHQGRRPPPRARLGKNTRGGAVSATWARTTLSLREHTPDRAHPREAGRAEPAACFSHIQFLKRKPSAYEESRRALRLESFPQGERGLAYRRLKERSFRPSAPATPHVPSRFQWVFASRHVTKRKSCARLMTSRGGCGGTGDEWGQRRKIAHKQGEEALPLAVCLVRASDSLPAGRWIAPAAPLKAPCAAPRPSPPACMFCTAAVHIESR